MKSEMKMPRDRDREVKFQNNSREFSRNKTLASYCHLQLVIKMATEVCQVFFAISLFYFESLIGQMLVKKDWAKSNMQTSERFPGKGIGFYSLKKKVAHLSHLLEQEDVLSLHCQCSSCL